MINDYEARLTKMKWTLQDLVHPSVASTYSGRISEVWHLIWRRLLKWRHGKNKPLPNSAGHKPSQRDWKLGPGYPAKSRDPPPHVEIPRNEGPRWRIGWGAGHENSTALPSSMSPSEFRRSQKLGRSIGKMIMISGLEILYLSISWNLDMAISGQKLPPTNSDRYNWPPNIGIGQQCTASRGTKS